jgi:hypothetical protein
MSASLLFSLFSSCCVALILDTGQTLRLQVLFSFLDSSVFMFRFSFGTIASTFTGGLWCNSQKEDDGVLTNLLLR